MLAPLSATTYVGQSIGVPTTWTKAGSPYIVTEDITIEEGSTLTIEQGATIYFSKNTQMRVAGNLVANGSSNQTIVWEGWNSDPWRGVLFLKTCNDYSPRSKQGVKLSYCIFRGSQGNTNPLLRSKGCNLLLEHCEINDCYAALLTERQAEIWLEHSTVRNSNRALSVRNTSIAHVQHNKFLNCNSILLGGTTNFESNSLKRFTSDGRHSGLIVWMLGGGKVTIRNNQFQKFEDYVVKVYKLTQRSSVLLERNDFKNNPTNLKLCCQYYNVGTVVIQQNNFHNCHRHHVHVYGRCEAVDPEILAIGRNYWGKLSSPDLELMTFDQTQDASLRARVLHAPPLDKAVKLR
jgi:hypothetical protein